MLQYNLFYFVSMRPQIFLLICGLQYILFYLYSSISFAGWTGKDGSPSPTLGTIIKKSYNGSSVLSTSLGSKTLNTSLGQGGTII